MTRFTRLLLLSSAFFSGLAHAQTPALEPFAVDSVAAPRGGVSMLETFLAVNLRKPIMAQVANVAGRVFLKAVVEPDGQLTDVTVLRSLRPDCDREALRVMRGFRAWKPALKDGKPVRQNISYSVIFRATSPVVLQEGKQLLYLDEQFAPLNNPLTARYVQATPIDTLTDLPNGDLVFYEASNGKKGKEISRYPLLRLPTNPQQPTGETGYLLGYKRPTSDWIGQIYTLRTDGSLLSIAPADGKTGQIITYAKNGLVERIQDYETGKITRWFPNGVLLNTDERLPKGANTNRLGPVYKRTSAWDSTGNPTVVGGNGYQISHSQLKSRPDSSRTVLFTEEGAYVDGRQHGLWKGYTADGSYGYEEQYKNGDCRGGKAVVAGKTIPYTEARQSPAFKGGVGQLYQFLGNNIQYPAEAQRGNIVGKVFVSFTVCADGSLCDYDVVKGVHPSLDEEALRVVRKMSGQWVPGTLRGEPIRVKYNLPVSFQLN